jgi:tRNA(fMet)-specific endonuclease VapC
VASLMLDSDVCIDAMRGHSRWIRRHLARTTPGEVAVSAIVVAELWTGAKKSGNPARAEEAVRQFLALVTELDWPAEAAQIYGEIRARLETSGLTIGAMDMLIAAHAIYERAALITRNQSEFRRVAGLKLETWEGR